MDEVRVHQEVQEGPGTCPMLRSGGGCFSDRYTWRRRVVAFQVVAAATYAVLVRLLQEQDSLNPFCTVLAGGGALTVASSSSVVVTYWKFKPWRVHPNPLVFWRSVVDLCYGVSLILLGQAYAKIADNPTEGVSSLQLLAVVLAITSFVFWLAAESWYVSASQCLSAFSSHKLMSEFRSMMLSVDLFRSTTSPLINCKRNLKWYTSFANRHTQHSNTGRFSQVPLVLLGHYHYLYYHYLYHQSGIL
jgi:hypothetical protein